MNKTAASLLGAASVLLGSSALAGDADSFAATLNNIPARVLGLDQRAADAGARYFASNDVAYAAGVRSGLGAGWQVGLVYNAFEATNDDTLGSSRVTSTWRGVELSVLKSLIASDRYALALQGSVEGRSRKTRVETTGVATRDDDALFGLALPMSLRIGQSLELDATLKAAFFNDQLTSSDGNAVEGFDDVLALTLGARYPLTSTVTLAADVTPILSGDN